MAFDCSFYVDTRKHFFHLLSYIKCNTISVRAERGRGGGAGRGGGEGGVSASAPQNFGRLRFVWATRKIWANNLF